MWKIIVGFIVFAAIGMWVIVKGGDKIDMGGEKHGADAIHAPEPASAASAPLPGVLGAPAKAASDMAAATAQAASAVASAAR
ncbi:MAG: hypothetical protein EOO28_29350 [Comamonadaceae bacterium]|nr:MAG: hypothetical protein EOO28_29350 [Comamonadaceae bacterium]